MRRYILIFLFLLINYFSYSQNPIPENTKSNKLKDSVFTSLNDALLNPEQVYQLLLSNQNLIEFPLEILKLKNLEYLNLGNNKLKILPPEIKELVNLKKLELYGNNLNYLPGEIGEMKLLSALTISNNPRLLTLPQEIWKLKLEVLDFANDNIIDLPKEFLESLSLNFSSSSYGPYLVGHISEGKRIFCKNGKMGVIESSGKMVMTPYDCLNTLYTYGGGINLPKFHNNRCFIYKNTSDSYISLVGFMDNSYKIIEKPNYYFLGGYCNSYYDYKNGLYPLVSKYSNETGIVNWVFIDTTGKKVFECNYSFGACTAACEFMPEFSENMCLFENANRKYGYLNSTGKIVIYPKYYGASNFSEGLACVIESKDLKNFYFSFINKQGKRAFEKTFNIKPFKLPYGTKDKDGFDGTSFVLHNEIHCNMRSEFLFNNGKCKIIYWDEKNKKEVKAIINTKGEITEYINE